MTDILRGLIQKGPYRSDLESPSCGFCGYPVSDTHLHAYDCPWPKFRDGYLQVWPEMRANLNDADASDYLQREVNGEREL